MSHRLPRRCRLRRRRLIRPLFSRDERAASSVTSGCIRLVYRVLSRAEVGVDVPVQVGFSAGRRIRKAVTRNRVKRVLREVYRVHQRLLVDLFASEQRALTVMVLFRGEEASAKACIPSDLPEALRLLAAHLKEEAGS